MCVLALIRLTAAGTVFYVDSLQGDDSNSGESPEQAFQTIVKCAKAIAKEEDEEDCTCLIAQGVYREEVAVPEAATRRSGSTSFIGSEGAEVCGLDVLDLEWELSSGPGAGIAQESCFFRAKLPETTFEFQQLFFRGEMMVEARWPNVDVASLPAQMLSVDDAWEPTNVGSRYGIVVDPSLSQFDFSWDGALATLNVAHQVRLNF